MSLPAVDLYALVDDHMVERFAEICRRRGDVHAGLRLVAKEVASAIAESHELARRMAMPGGTDACRCIVCMNAVIEETARVFEMTPAELRKSRRLPHLVHARWVAMHVMSERGWKLREIGAALRIGHHATVIHGLREIAAHPALLAQAARIERAVRRVHR